MDRHLKASPPDYTEQRDGLHLLIWKDVPHWLVADGDFLAFLRGLNGQDALGEVLAGKPAWATEEQAICDGLRPLLDVGVVSDARGGERGVGSSPDAAVRIENISINITRRCNLQCAFCYNKGALDSASGHELTVLEIAAFLEQARPLLGERPSITILGGEPLLRAEAVLALGQAAARQGFVPIVSTNGTLVTADFARRAAMAGLQVQVSLDGHNAELNDLARGRGAFDLAVAGVGTLVRNGVYTIISQVCHEANFPRLEDFYGFASRLGVNEARFIPLKLMGGGAEGRFRPVAIRELLLAARSMLRRHPEFIPLTGRDCLSIMADSCRHAARRRSCGTGLQTVLLDSDGALYPCPNTDKPEFRIGSIRDAGFDFAETWRDSAVLARVRDASDVDRMNGTCAACPVRYWCLGGCRGETYATTGLFGGPAYNCDDLRQSITEVLWILAETPEIVRSTVPTC
jgi:radical SAM protein with 4Fe4S-binding SPASM domain